MAGHLNYVSLLWICVTVVPLVHGATFTFGQFNKATTLKCPLTPVSKIEWYDWVYSLTADTPATIYKNGKISDDSYHKDRFSVDKSSGHLTISDLSEDDVGVYFCNTSATDKHEFQLILAELPECKGEVRSLREGDETKLQCDMKYSGSQAPRLEWLREDQILSDFEDKNEIGKASVAISIQATADMNKNNFICRAVIGEMVEDCSLTFEVKFKAQEPVFEPEAKSYAVGTTVDCVINANPEASVKVTLPDGEVKEGQGRVKVVIPEEWESTDKFIHCEGMNTVDGMEFTTARNYTFSVSGRAEPEEGGTTGGEGDGSGGNNQLAGIVAGIVIGAVVLVIIIVAVVCIRKRKSKPPKV